MATEADKEEQHLVKPAKDGTNSIHINTAELHKSTKTRVLLATTAEIQTLVEKLSGATLLTRGRDGHTANQSLEEA
jgi:hypothetical protein